MSWVSQIIATAQAAGATPASILADLQSGVGAITGGVNAQVKTELHTLLRVGANVKARQAMVTKIETMSGLSEAIISAVDGLGDPSLTQAQILAQVNQIDQALDAGL